MAINNYFATGLEVFPFDDTRPHDTIRAWENAKAFETTTHRMRVWREVTGQVHLCRRLVGHNNKPLDGIAMENGEFRERT
jgi:hypothetical protein